MALKPKFTLEDINRAVQAEFDKIDTGITEIFHRVGEEFVTNARMGLNIDAGAFPKGDYTDRTANLRASIGYAVIRNGAIVYDEIHGPEGRKIIDQILHLSIGANYKLIGIAAMEYASYLESMGYNVISSQGLVAFVDLTDQLKKFSKGKPFDFGGISPNISSKL